jgi:hypothetical protein
MEALWSLLREPYPWGAVAPSVAGGDPPPPVPVPAPGQRILFGEWCALQHTVSYDQVCPASRPPALPGPGQQIALEAELR